MQPVETTTGKKSLNESPQANTKRIALDDVAKTTKRRLRRIGNWFSVGPKLLYLLVGLAFGFSIPALLWWSVYKPEILLHYGLNGSKVALDYASFVREGWSESRDLLLMTFCLSPTFIPILVLGGWIANWQIRRLGAQIEDPRLIGELVDLLERFRRVNDTVSDEKLARIFTALTNILPQLSSNEALALVGKRGDYLCKLLEKQRNVTPDFCVALMEALPLFGGQRAMTAVRHVYKTTRDPRLKRVSSDCLPLLEERLQTLQSTQTLRTPFRSANIFSKGIAPASNAKPTLSDTEF